MRPLLTLYRVPQPWLNILGAIQLSAPEAVIAGGALRDLDNGAEVKDLDVFVEHKLTHGLPGFGILDKLQRIDPFAYRANVSDFSSCIQDSDCVLSETFRVSGLDVNVVHLEGTVTMSRVLSRIDFGICQIGTDGTGIGWLPAYSVDQEARTFTVTRFDSSDDNARTLRRWDRLSQKYPGWTLVNPWVAA